MNRADRLYLASSSRIRRYLLSEVGITYTVLKQSADESQCDWTLPPYELAPAIAEHKMNHVDLSPVAEKTCFVLTADSVVTGADGTSYGKPVDRNDAIKTIKALRGNPVTVVTGFCLEKKERDNDVWRTVKRVVSVAGAECQFSIPDEYIDIYLEKTHALTAAGSATVEGYGAQFFKSINGSYPAVLGLPLYELREQLAAFGFRLI